MTHRIIEFEPLLRNIDRRTNPMRIPLIDRNDNDVFGENIHLCESVDRQQSLDDDGHTTFRTFFVHRLTPAN